MSPHLSCKIFGTNFWLDMMQRRGFFWATVYSWQLWRDHGFEASKDRAVKLIILICRRDSADDVTDDVMTSTLCSSWPRTKGKCSAVNRFLQLSRSTASSRYLHTQPNTIITATHHSLSHSPSHLRRAKLESTFVRKCVCIYGRTNGRTFDTGFIRSTLSKSRTKYSHSVWIITHGSGYIQHM